MPPPGSSSFRDHRSKDCYFVEVDCGDVLQVVVMKDFENIEEDKEKIPPTTTEVFLERFD